MGSTRGGGVGRVSHAEGIRTKLPSLLCECHDYDASHGKPTVMQRIRGSIGAQNSHCSPSEIKHTERVILHITGVAPPVVAMVVSEMERELIPNGARCASLCKSKRFYHTNYSASNGSIQFTDGFSANIDHHTGKRHGVCVRNINRKTKVNDNNKCMLTSNELLGPMCVYETPLRGHNGHCPSVRSPTL